MTARAAVVLILCLCFPSLAPVQRFFGLSGVMFYVAAVSCVVFLAGRIDRRLLLPSLGGRGSLVAFAAFIFFLLVVFIVLYPIADKGILGGSDVDDALNAGVRGLLNGRYPYYENTYLGNYPSPLPGAIFLSVPFYLLGNAAYQNIFWLMVLFFFLRFYFGGYKGALFFVGMLFALSPAVFLTFITGSDYFSNSIYVLVFSYLLIDLCRRPGYPVWIKYGLACLLGIALSSRANFFLILPLVFSAILRECGPRTAFAYSLLAFAALVSVTLPFYLYDPNQFYPFRHAAIFTKFSRLDRAEINSTVIFTTSALTALLCLRLMRRGLASFLASCALSQALPAVALVAIYMVAVKSSSFYLSGFGMIFMLFGALAACSRTGRSFRKIEKIGSN